MQTLPQVLLSRSMRVRPDEYEWVTRIITASKNNPQVKEGVLKWQPGTYPNNHVIRDPIISNDGHSGGTLCWSVCLAQHVLKTGASLEKHVRGIGYHIPI